MLGMDANTIGLIFIAVLTAYTAWTNRQASKERAKMAIDIATTMATAHETKAIALKTELNTNSIVAKGLELQAQASKAEGMVEGRANEKADEAIRASARLGDDIKPKGD